MKEVSYIRWRENEEQDNLIQRREKSEENKLNFRGHDKDNVEEERTTGEVQERAKGSWVRWIVVVAGMAKRRKEEKRKMCCGKMWKVFQLCSLLVYFVGFIFVGFKTCEKRSNYILGVSI